MCEVATSSETSRYIPGADYLAATTRRQDRHRFMGKMPSPVPAGWRSLGASRARGHVRPSVREWIRHRSSRDCQRRRANAALSRFCAIFRHINVGGGRGNAQQKHVPAAAAGLLLLCGVLICFGRVESALAAAWDRAPHLLPGWEERRFAWSIYSLPAGSVGPRRQRRGAQRAACDGTPSSRRRGALSGDTRG